MNDDIHVHIIERTGIMGISQYDKKLPCSKCQWGHEAVGQTTDYIAKRVRQMREECRQEAIHRGFDRSAFYEGEMRGYWKVLSLISPDPNATI